MSHTPGARRLNGSSLEVFFEGIWLQIACMSRSHFSYPDQEMNQRFRPYAEDDAHLLLAAPDMEEALYLWRRADAMLCNEPGLDADIALSKAREATDAALAKVHGRELEDV